MNIVYISVILFIQPLLLHSAMPTCPESFSCQSFSPFKYPFYNSNNTQCGLIQVNCTPNGGDIQLGGQSCTILYKLDSNSSFFIYNKTFENLLKEGNCKALTHNFTSPSPLLFSFSISPFITIFKCPKNLSDVQQTTDAYFDKSNFSSHSKCEDHNYFYYKHYNNISGVPSNLPDTCQVIQLPLKQSWQFGPDENTDKAEIFHLFSSTFSISFPLSATCETCLKNGSHCLNSNGQIQCFDVKKEKPSKGHTVILALAGFAFILMICPLIFIIWRCCKSNPFSYFSSKHKSPVLEDDGSLFLGVYVFSYSELEDATKNFDPSHELGDGGFGAVYYGKLQDGREVAVKRLYEHNYKRLQQFMNEVKIVTKLRHRNLVLLYGCTSRQSRELLLVYEYISNGTVADHLHGKHKNPSLLKWPIRMSIAIETARALVYLHANEIIHRDIKTNNILLDHNFSVKVADFGLSRLVPNNATHVSTAPQGTPGYMDPEYHLNYQLTDKSDVYSFGVVLIELISSMVAFDFDRSRDEMILANLALNRIQKGSIDQLIDPVLGSDSDDEIKRMITSVAELAFQCLQFDSEMRPTMNEVLKVLIDIKTNGRTDAHETTIDAETLKPPPLSETSDQEALLKDSLASPVSVITNEWQSDDSASTTLSNADRVPIKNHISR
uniref:LEAF RUST 10 DISEASE-RESISTANCE LOCUS RECEPTOR-LIKE PROTEIN KINASE-like 1.1 n=1 Tax=Erigeron canadensis TaxID=72917 RepID=UPI001CB99575|nr:LEAF RUST 10 DISEASE-RESISTANCE LOCUS RECEPTOR-LIKE PROTEIN KINASE-like 1.1 [Erigeron canadensis]